ncbi:hypothetical protein [Brevibacillus sp. NRS-1366]|uniref:hypothetical protein n=1 Tax=Brevibacillus sp. NRS-1366 TaxID=3233899 RepID=UPI003D218FA2
MIQCFKIKHGTKYDRAVKKYIEQRPKWANVIKRMAELLEEEKLTQIVLSVDKLWINIEQLTKEDIKKLFNKDGKVKSNSNRAKELNKQYKQIIADEGLSDFQDVRLINFCYGVMRLQGQKLESFFTSEGGIYFKADFDLENRSNGMVAPISEIEYEEKYLEELKKEKGDK